MCKSLFITGTDTNVGKTVITSAISLLLQDIGYEVGIYKPVQSGHLIDDPLSDGMTLKRLGKVSLPIEEMVTYSFKDPLSPNIAAEIAGINISMDRIKEDFNKISKRVDIVLVEGAGGLMVPIANNKTILDLVTFLDTPLLTVARPYLGTVNHTILTTKTAEMHGIKNTGVVINGVNDINNDQSIQKNPEMIESFTGLPVFGRFPTLTNLRSDVLLNTFRNTINTDKLLKCLGWS